MLCFVFIVFVSYNRCDRSWAMQWEHYDNSAGTHKAVCVPWSSAASSTLCVAALIRVGPKTVAM